MRVGLIQLDGKMPNLALMELAAWHRERGDEITVLDLSGFSFDRTYGSKIFMGGSGYDMKATLPPNIEAVIPDYELFHMSKGERIGFTSRGCIRDCGFCIVREKEGAIRDLPFDWVNGAEKIILLDNNFLASPLWREKLEYFIRQRLKVCFTQGLDIRLVTEENAVLLAQVKYYDRKFGQRRLYFAFDDPVLETIVRQKVALLNAAGIPSKHLLFYVLVGYNTVLEDDLHRVHVLDELGCLPYIMVWNNHASPALKKLDKWVNGRYYQLIRWEDFDLHKTHGKLQIQKEKPVAQEEEKSDGEKK